MKPKELAYDKIYRMMQSRISKPGQVRTGDAWVACRNRSKLGYATITSNFRMIMNELVEQKKAKKLRNGIWEILKIKNMSTETLQINKSNAIKAFNEANDKGKTLLTNLFGKEVFNQKITERVKSFLDACMVTGANPNDEKFHKGTPDDIAYQKLKVIAMALREGVVLNYGNSDQRKWYPYFQYGASGFRFYDTNYDITNTNANGSSHLC